MITLLLGCRSSVEPLTFPRSPIRHTADGDWYNVKHNGKPDFGVLRDSSGKVNVLEYDDDEDGTPDRIYRLSDYANESVPASDYPAGFGSISGSRQTLRRWPVRLVRSATKVIPVFPSLTEQVFTRILGAPPLPGMIDDSYDSRMARSHLGIGERISGYHQPWEYRCNYCASYSDAALSYLNPDPLLHKEMELTRRHWTKARIV